MTSKKGMLRAFAVCSDCGLSLDARNAQGVGAKHHYKTGHEVHIEVTYVQIFSRVPRKDKIKKEEKDGSDKSD